MAVSSAVITTIDVVKAHRFCLCMPRPDLARVCFMGAGARACAVEQ